MAAQSRGTPSDCCRSLRHNIGHIEDLLRPSGHMRRRFGKTWDTVFIYHGISNCLAESGRGNRGKRC